MGLGRRGYKGLGAWVGVWGIGSDGLLLLGHTYCGFGVRGGGIAWGWGCCSCTCNTIHGCSML